MIPTWTRTLVLALVPAALAACTRSDGGPHESGPPVAVRVVAVTPKHEPGRLPLAGELVSTRRAEIASKIAGRIVAFPVTEGTRVRRGDLLVRLDSPEMVSALEQSKAGEDAARQEMEVASRQADRMRRLARAEVVTPRDLELTELAETGARAGYERARSMTEMAEANLGYASLRADHDGVVVRRLAREGDLATPGRPLLILEDETGKEIRVTLPAPPPWTVRAGDAAVVTLPGVSDPLAATVTRVAPSADHYTLEAYLSAPGVDVPTGTFLDVALVSPESTDALRVPDEALIHRGPLTGVFAVHDGRAVLRWLRFSPDGRVLAGLDPGDSVVVAPPADLEDGERVEAGS
jgi:RND family efflux transporter MFP subunit